MFSPKKLKKKKKIAICKVWLEYHGIQVIERVLNSKSHEFCVIGTLASSLATTTLYKGSVSFPMVLRSIIAGLASSIQLGHLPLLCKF